MSKSNSQEKSTPDACISHQQMGAKRRGAGTLLRVRTGTEGPESNWRELSWDSNLNCGIARDREKINQSKHTDGCSQNKGTEKLQRRASLWWTSPSPPEAGGRGKGKVANLAPEMASPTTLQTSLQFLSKDILRFWMVDIHREGRG